MENSDLFICVDHIGMVYPEVDTPVKFLTEVMGWRELHRETNDDQGIIEVMLGTGEQLPQNTQLQIIAPIRDDASVAKYLEKNRPGMHHVAYRVADIDAVSATLRERGVKLLYDEPRFGTHGSRINFLHPKNDASTLIEIVEPAH